MPTPLESMRIVARRLEPLKWFPEALALASSQGLGEEVTARVITPALFLATKLEAFKDRAKGDFYASHDLEDVITILDGRAGIVADIDNAPAPVRSFVAGECEKFLRDPNFLDALPGHLAAISRGRLALILERIKQIAALRDEAQN